MPQTPEERRKTFESLARKRQRMIDDERAKQAERERVAGETVGRQKEASLAEQRQLEERGETREAWRTEQHAKREADLDAARAREEERRRAEEKKAKEEEARKEREERMRELHRRGVTQRVAERKHQAEMAEEESVGRTRDGLERDLRDLQSALDRSLAHVAQHRLRALEKADDDARRQESALAQRHPVRSSEYKRALLVLQARTLETKQGIEAEHARLKDEAIARADERRLQLRTSADRRVREAHDRRESANKWIR